MPVCAQVDPKCGVFVGNVPFDVEDEELWRLFVDVVGPDRIDSVRVIRDKVD